MVVAGGEKGIKGWTSDAGRGRVLQTGQSLLATALDGASEVREILASMLISLTSPKTGGVRPIQCIPQIQSYAAYVQWFRPSTAAGEIKCVDVVIACRLNVDIQSFPEWQLTGISSRRMRIRSRPPIQSPRLRKLSRWGGRAVIVLIGIQHGIDGVIPIYYGCVIQRAFN